MQEDEKRENNEKSENFEEQLTSSDTGKKRKKAHEEQYDYEVPIKRAALEAATT